MDLHVLGNPRHHFFGVFIDYLTQKVLRINSVIISSKRISLGNEKSTEVSQKALSHYEYPSVSEIKKSIVETRKFCFLQNKILSSDLEKEIKKSDKVIKDRESFMKNVQKEMVKTGHRTDNIMKKKVELSKLCSLLELCHEMKTAASP
jgi:hypothetical protein